MFSSKFRTVLALFVAVFSVALASGPITSGADAQIKSNPTGNSELDGICARIAGLINYANSQGDLAMIDGDDAAAQAWYDLADDMIRRGTNVGCKLVAGSYHTPGGDVTTVGPPQVSDGGKPGPGLHPGVIDGAVIDGAPTVSDGGPAVSGGGPVLLREMATDVAHDLRATKAKAKRLLRKARAVGH